MLAISQPIISQHCVSSIPGRYEAVTTASPGLTIASFVAVALLRKSRNSRISDASSKGGRNG
jgi:hypothetical protein